MSTVEQHERLVAPILEHRGVELVDVEFRPGTVRVILDKDGGLDLDAIGEASAAISRALDAADIVPGGSYELEVSSPGLERRLRRPGHFMRQLGESIAVRTRTGVEGDRRVEGRLVHADEDGLVLESEDLPEGQRAIAYQDIERAHTVFDWRGALAGTQAPSARREHKAARRDRKSSAAHSATTDVGRTT